MASSGAVTVLTKVPSIGRCFVVLRSRPTRRLSQAVARSLGSPTPTSRVWGALHAYRPQCRPYVRGTSRDDHEHPERGDEQPQQVHFFISPPSPIRWLRKKIGCFVIRTSMDPSFSLDAFLIGAKQAFILVSTYLSQSRYEDLKGLVSEEALAVMCTKYEAMPQSSRRHLAVATKDIANINPIDIGVWFDDKGGKFASVWIRFLFMSKMLKPGEQVEHVQVLYRRKHQPLGVAGTLDGDRLILVAFYMFHRDFSNENGWIITRTCYSLPE